MSKIDENRLKADLKAGQLARAYFLYGKEDYLVRFFANKITELAAPEDARDMNFVKYTDAESRRTVRSAGEYAVFLGV